VKAQVRAVGGPIAWSTPVDLYFRRTSDGWTLVGLERLPQQPVVEVPRRTETGEAPGDPDARRANIGNIQPTSNAERRDASLVECSGTSTTGC
jgi:hypothetical protein